MLKIIFITPLGTQRPISQNKPMKAYIFPGQGAQFPGMGRDLFDQSPVAQSMMLQADTVLGYSITDLMFDGSAEDLKETKVTQPAIFLHSVALAASLGDQFKPDVVAGHSLGEFSALVANKTLAMEDALRLVYARAMAMQSACELTQGTMAAVLGLADELVEQVCADTPGVVVAANYNCPGQLVISGALAAVEQACEALKAAGAKRALLLPVGGAFHSPLMEPARTALAEAIAQTTFHQPICPVVQNVHAQAVTDPLEIKENLIAQLTAPVKWTQSVQFMAQMGVTEFVEVGPGKVLQGLVKKITPELEAVSAVL